MSSRCANRNCVMRRSLQTTTMTTMTTAMTMMTTAMTMKAARPHPKGKWYVTYESFYSMHYTLSCATYWTTVKGKTKRQLDEAARQKLPRVTHSIVSDLQT